MLSFVQIGVSVLEPQANIHGHNFNFSLYKITENICIDRDM
jgi:hypothetical protein